MLVVVSDLHFCDESASRNIPPKAFALWLDEVLELALHNEAKELVLLYPGDVFDLLRTEFWFYPEPAASPVARGEPDRLQVGTVLDKANANGRQEDRFPLALRPWGRRDVNASPAALDPRCLVRAREILEVIRRRCHDSLALMRCRPDQVTPAFAAQSADVLASIRTSLAALSARGCAVRTEYLPGNHDRLVRVDPELRAMVAESLGVALDAPPASTWRSERYRVLARHGQEWDAWNFEAPCKDGAGLARLTQADFQKVPIGDPITTELVARLPWEVWLALRDGPAAPWAAGVYEHLKVIEDVRPLSAALKWVLARGVDANQDWSREVEPVLTRTIREAMAAFMAIPFVEQWLHEHDHWGLGFDEADQLQDVARLVRLLDVRAVPKVLDLVEKLQKLGVVGGGDPYLAGAVQEPDLRGDSVIHHCVYGHTHTFAHVPLSETPSGAPRVYLNSGTWRPRVAQAHDGEGFLQFKEMTWLIFYAGDEDPGKTPGTSSYETWNGFMVKPGA